MHQKRRSIPKSWPIPRKAKKYIIVQKSSHKKELSLSLLVVLRDLMGLVKNAAEAKKILRNGEVEINHQKVLDEKRGLGLLDILNLKKLNKSFIMSITEKGKLFVKETKNNKQKISRVVGKKVLNKNQIQINLEDGRNILTKEKANVGDSILFDLEKKTILKILPLKKEAEVFITSGKWKGHFSKITNIEKPFLEAMINNQKKTIPIKNVIVINEKW